MIQKLRILHLEDEPKDAELIQARLEEQRIEHEILVVSEEKEYIAALEQGVFDIILADYRLPSYDGLQALKAAQKICPETPFIFVTGTMGEEIAVESLRSGAADFVLKNNLVRLVSSIRRALIEAENMHQRRLAVEALEASEKQYRELYQQFNALLDAIPDALLLLSPELKIIWTNSTAGRYAGKDIVGSFCYEAFHNDKTPSEGCPSLRSIKSGTFESEIILTSDEKVWDMRAVPIMDSSGNIVNVMELARDITEHRRLEEQLRHSQKLEGIGQLAGGIAHDFNNVLNAVVGFAGLIQMKMDRSDPLMHYADEIMAAGQRGAELTHQILAFSRKQVLDMKPVNLNEILKSLEKMLHRLVREDISIELNFNDKDLVVLADPSQIGQVLINLVTNARDAMPDGGRLGISTEPFVMDREYIEMHGYGSSGKYAVLTVSDSGCGMDSVTKLRIFEPFFTTKDVGKGTGLGLAVVHGIVKQHNGYINIYSEVGNGTIFKIYLPLTEHAAEEIKENAEDQIRGGNETILIAEDDEPLRRLSSSLLSHYGYRVIEAADGEDAILKFAENRDLIKLVILDGIMPKKNGREAFDEIISLCPDMKAIFVSGYAEDVFTHDDILDRTAVYIRKPVLPKDLLRKVREILDKT